VSTLNNAVNALHQAENFTKSVEGQPTSRFAPKPSGQHANAPYSMAKPPAPKAPNLGDELGSKARNVKEYEDATK
jgi:hypothetical protein